MTVYDCFTYDGEECLDLRLRTHWEQVDVFVIVEAAITFSGMAKALSFDVERYAWALDKIRYIPLSADEFAACQTAWDRERLQRNALQRGYADAAPDDLVIISDVDEILRPACLKVPGPGEVLVFEQLMLYFFCDYLQVSEPFWRKAIGTRADLALRHAPDDLRNDKALRKTLREVLLANAGWHFSYLGGMEMVERKLQRFSHQNLNKPRYRNSKQNVARLRAGKDIYRRARRWGRVIMANEMFESPVVQGWFAERPALWAPADIRSVSSLNLVMDAYRRQRASSRPWRKLWLRLWNFF